MGVEEELVCEIRLVRAVILYANGCTVNTHALDWATCLVWEGEVQATDPICMGHFTVGILS